MGDIDPRLAEILRFLNDVKVRATYKAVADIVGGSAQSIGRRLGARRIEASWVVNASTEMPIGYAPNQLHPELTAHSNVIRTGDQLKQRLSLWRLPAGWPVFKNGDEEG